MLVQRKASHRCASVPLGLTGLPQATFLLVQHADAGVHRVWVGSECHHRGRANGRFHLSGGHVV